MPNVGESGPERVLTDVRCAWRSHVALTARSTPAASPRPRPGSRTGGSRGSGRPPPRPPRAGRSPRPDAGGGSAWRRRRPSGSPAFAAAADQCASRPQPISSSGSGSSVGNASAWIAVTGPISTKRVRRAIVRGSAAGDRPGGVRGERVRGLGELQAEALGDEHERVEEAGGEDDVVVDDAAASRLPGRMRGERVAQVRPLAESGRARSEVELDVVARALQLGADRLRDRGVLRPRDAGDEHVPARRVGRRAPHRRALRRSVRTSAAASRARPASSAAPPEVPDRPER